MPSIRCILDSQYFAAGDIGIATSYLCLAAESQNLGTCIIGIYDRDEIRKALDIPQHKKIAALIAVGYPADDKVREKSRKPLEEIVRFV